jgi:hypothetical protein
MPEDRFGSCMEGSACDWDETVTPIRRFDMTLTYAIIADGGIVLAADSQSVNQQKDSHGEVVAAYDEEKSKIRTLKNGSIFSVAGNAGIVDAMLAKADANVDPSLPFKESAVEYGNVFRGEYASAFGHSKYPVRCAFLFCGYQQIGHKKVPGIIKLSSDFGFFYNPVATGKGYGFTGREQHGGVLYLHHRLYAPHMPIDSAKCLAYCVLSEVADLDNTVGGPIEMAVVAESGVEQFTGFDRYEQKRQRIVDAVRSLIHSS